MMFCRRWKVSYGTFKVRFADDDTGNLNLDCAEQSRIISRAIHDFQLF